MATPLWGSVHRYLPRSICVHNLESVASRVLYNKKKVTKFTKKTGFDFRVTEGHRHLTLSLDLEVIVDLSAFRSPHTSIPQSRIISISL